MYIYGTINVYSKYIYIPEKNKGRTGRINKEKCEIDVIKEKCLCIYARVITKNK